MRLERPLFPFLLYLLLSQPLSPGFFQGKAHSSQMGGGGSPDTVRMEMKPEGKIPPWKGVEFGLGTNRRENILIILDASGSMWGQISLKRPDNISAQKCKIEIAKMVLEEYIDDLDKKNVNVGLRVFGRHREMGCRDSQLIIPVKPLDREAFKSTVRKIKPGHLGKTPIAYSLRKALVDISTPHDIRRFLDAGKLSGGKKSIILITDGEGGCDTPAEVRGLEDDLRLLGVDIVKINVITLKVPEKQRHNEMPEMEIQSDTGPHLKKIVQETEGQYISIEAKPGMGIEEFERQFSRSMRMVAPTNTKERLLRLLYQGIHRIHTFISTHMSATIIPSMILLSIFLVFAMRWLFQR